MNPQSSNLSPLLPSASSIQLWTCSIADVTDVSSTKVSSGALALSFCVGNEGARLGVSVMTFCLFTSFEIQSSYLMAKMRWLSILLKIFCVRWNIMVQFKPFKWREKDEVFVYISAETPWEMLNKFYFWRKTPWQLTKHHEYLTLPPQ